MSQTHRNMMGYGLEIEMYSAGDEFPKYERKPSRVHKKMDSIKLISDIDDSGEWIRQQGQEQQGGQQGQQQQGGQQGQQGQQEWRQDAFLRISSIFSLLKPEQQGQQGQQEEQEYVSSRKRIVGSGQRQRQRPMANAYVSDTDSGTDSDSKVEQNVERRT
jgi:hypothetical protein